MKQPLEGLPVSCEGREDCVQSNVQRAIGFRADLAAATTSNLAQSEKILEEKVVIVLINIFRKPRMQDLRSWHPFKFTF